MPRHVRQPSERMEFARTDSDLITRLHDSNWLHGYTWTVPVWLATVKGTDGDPSRIREDRLDDLRDDSKGIPRTANEYRYIRNKAVIKQIYAEVRRQQPERVKPYAQSTPPPPPPSPPAQTQSAPVIDLTADDDDESTSSRSSYVPPFRRPAPSTTAVVDTARHPTEADDHRKHDGAQLLSPASSQPFRERIHQSARAASEALTRHQPRPGRTLPANSGSTAASGSRALVPVRPELPSAGVASADQALRAFAAQFNPGAQTYVPGAFTAKVDHLLSSKLTNQYLNRIEEGNKAIRRLQSEKVALLASLEGEIQLKQEAAETLRALHMSQDLRPRDLSRSDSSNCASQQPQSPPKALVTVSQTDTERSTTSSSSAVARYVDAALTPARQTEDSKSRKRKATMPSPMRMGDETNGHNEHDLRGHLQHLANKIAKDLNTSAANETVHLCGLAPLHIIATEPDKVLELAHGKLHTFPYQHVPVQWRRLYEEASLHKAVELLQTPTPTDAIDSGREGNGKRRKIGHHPPLTITPADDWLQELVNVLDKGISMSGAPGRKSTFDAVFQQLDNLTDYMSCDAIASSFQTKKPKALIADHHIARADKPLNFEGFQTWLNNTATPLIVPGALEHWPASQVWSDPNYLLRQTLGGRRLVPVEIGESYTAEGWSQRTMTIREFMTTHLLSDSPAQTGYLAQHDLFAQIPGLKEDVQVPDYCYTSPPATEEVALETAALSGVKQLDEPLLNAWLGPKGTKTPLHTDPYHNILCQVIGYKYIRLYAPLETPNLYPRGVDGKGIDMHNTSQVDVSLYRASGKDASAVSQSLTTDLADAFKNSQQKFPLFEEARYVEGILGPGECLYVPLGWWHYVEGLTTSFSVSFWWN